MWESVVQIQAVKVDIGVVIYEGMTPQCVRSVVQVLVVRVDIGVVIYEAMTLQCVRSGVQFQAVKVHIDLGLWLVVQVTRTGWCLDLFTNPLSIDHC